MSDKKNLSDYNKPRTDLNRLLPDYNLLDAKVLEGLNENLFNRFFTKDEVDRIVGFIGSDEFTTEDVNQILEPTASRQANQLQPIIYNKVGNIDWFMSFRDFMNRLSLLGVNIDRFNEWGNSLQFNWVPPVDIDKLINFQDYFWDSTGFDDSPQYITIKDQCQWVTARQTQMLKGIATVMPSYQIVGYDDAGVNQVWVDGNQTATLRVGEPIVLSGSSQTPITATVVSTFFNVSTSRTEIEVSDFTVVVGTNDVYTFVSETELSVVSTNEANKSIVVTSDVTNLFEAGYIFSAELSATGQPMRLFSVASSTFDVITGLTTVTVNEDLTNTFDWTIVTTKPLIRSINAETNTVCESPYSRAGFGSFDESLIGDIIWTRFTELVNSTSGVAEGTNLGQSLFSDSSVGKDFLDGEIVTGDILRISGTGFDGDYPINNIVTSNIVDLGRTFFTQAEISYEVVRPRSLSDITFDIAPSALAVDQLWVDTVNNQLRQWDGALWNVVVDNFNLLVDINNNAHLIDLGQSNDWVTQNNWVHRTEINNFTGKSRAQQPIIEYFPHIKLSAHSFADKQWRYRRDNSVSYVASTNEPTLLELLDTRVVIGGEVAFQNDTTLVFDEKFGNLTSDLTEGVVIQLGDFSVNSGQHTVLSSEFVQLAPGTRYRTRVVLLDPVNDPLDVPVGAYVAPLTTSLGDAWVSFETFHWQFEGIEDIAASSIEPVVNPMLNEIINSSTSSPLQTILGLVFQEFKREVGTGSEFGSTFELDSSLHDLALYEDFQEGDVRVYINGQRQFGNFLDQQSSIDSDFVGGIKFNSDVEITEEDVIRIELGEYALDDIGKRDVIVNTVSGTERFNLVDLRRLEQVKNERSQYPFFNVYDVNKSPQRFATEIFRYKDVSTGTYFPDIDQRIFFDSVSQDYSFEQKLLDPTTGELYLYFDSREFGDEFQSIWKRGLNNEQFVPVEADDFWSIPNQLYYNVSHENRETVKLTEVFRHFNTIILEQSAPGIVSNSFTNVHHLDNAVNYGLGGRIKEHNDGFDTLLSAMFVNNVNPIDLIHFANDRYNNNEITLKEIFQDNIVSYFNTASIDDVDAMTAFVQESVKDSFEKNDRLDQWFGDSTTFDESTNLGVKNHIATIPFLGLIPKVQPYLLEDDNLLQLVRHDGHRSDIRFNPATLESIFRIILQGTNSETQVVGTSIEAFPALINGSPPALGDALVRTVTSESARKLYRFSNTNVWEEVDLSLMFAGILLNIEESLFQKLGDEALPVNFESRFDFTAVTTDSEYANKIQEQFSQFIRDRGIDTPFVNTQFIQNDPFTWNYAYTNVSTDPVTGGVRTDVRASWQGLYNLVYGTPVPHLEPWALQGYESKPLFWDTSYLNSSPSRRWVSSMWTNILNGVVPVGNTAPDGTAGTGASGQITTLFTFIPVNIESTNTTDGIAPDNILPPFWNSANSVNPAVRSLYDANLQEFIVTPSAGYEFGQEGPAEWSWKISSERLYDELIVAFKLQPMKFLNQSFGPELIDVACLQVDARVNKVAAHENIEFHGDINLDNAVVKVNGLNQWYVHFNRYNGFDGISSEFRPMWKDWTAPLTYQFGSFIDTQNFKISSDNFDVTTSDYDIIFKKSQGINDVWLDALKTTLISTPSRFADDTEAGLDWTATFNNTSPVGRPIISFGVQNYPIRVISGDSTYKTFSFELTSAEIQESVGFDIVQYSETAADTVATSLNNDTTLYFAEVLFNGVDNVSLSIQGNLAQTFGELVAQIDLQLGTDGNAFLENGNLVIESGLVGGTTSTTITDSGLFATASTFFLGTSGNSTALIRFEKVFFTPDNSTQFFPIGSTFEMVDSTNFNGTFTVVSSTYDLSQGQTRIEVQEDVGLSSTVVDGFMEPDTAVTLPDEWVTGVGLHWSSNGTVPEPFDDINLFYMIRINDREFQLAASSGDAISGVAVPPFGEGTNQQYIGRVKNTFSAQNVQAFWKQHVVDSRVSKSFPTPTSISGVQNMVDFINGYAGYLESLGLLFIDTDGQNRDSATGRANDWQIETEKFIEFMYSSRNNTAVVREEFTVVPDSAGNSFTSTNVITWNTGTRVTLDVDSGTLPAEFDGPVANKIAYYVIRGAVNGRLQLAASPQAAIAGTAITFTDNGSGTIVLRITPEIKSFPTHEINPQSNSISIDHETGIVADIFAGSNLDLLTDQRVYDTDGQNLTIDDLIVSRKDLRTQIQLSQQRITANDSGLVPHKTIGGMHLFFDGFEHVIQYANYSSDGSLIYDAFLGINTPRFFLELDRQTSFTLRPNVGGTVVLDQEQVQNIESSIEALRFAYSTSRAKEGDQITKKVRDGLGYDGPYEYADDLGITDKSQFLFYRGLIQKKGTNFAANAFTNQNTYDDVEVDEFWAYKLATFGDSKEKSYPELNLFSSDVNRKELRLEFLAPLGTVTDASFQGIELASEERWFEQPDQVETLDPRDRFYINVNCVERFENVARSPSFFILGTSEFVELNEPADAAFINYVIPLSEPRQFLQLTEGVNYELVTKTLIRFFGAILPTSFEVNIATLTYNYDAQNPAKIINRRDGVVVTELPIWNPARQQYYSKAIDAVDFRTGDTSSFSLIVGQTEATHIGNFVGGRGFVGGEVITLSNGSTVQVDAIVGDTVTGFTVLTTGGRVVTGTQLLQVGVINGTGSGFALTVEAINLAESLQSNDPARYNTPIDAGDITEPNFWDMRFQNKVWFYSAPEGYLPFDERNVETNSNERFKNWGKLSEWGEIKVYQWTKSDVLPSEYDSLASQDELEANLPIDSRKTGIARKVVFRNDGTAVAPVWVTEEDQHYDFVTIIVTATTYPTVLFGEEVEVYLDGLLNTTTTFIDGTAFETFATALSGVLLHVIKRATVPTSQQLEELTYKLDTPYSVVSRIDAISGQPVLTYYFWVEDRLSSIPILGGPTGSITLRTVREGLQNIPTPFMIPNNIIDLTTTSFADLFITNSPRRVDTVSYEFPFAYNQLVVKGLAGTVQSDNAYTLRFTRDFTLRDRMPRPDRTFQLIPGQSELSYDGIGQNGTFTPGTAYEVNDIIVLSNGNATFGQPDTGALVTVLTVFPGGIVATFSVDTTGNNIDGINQTLTQIAVNTGSGNGFELNVGRHNVNEKLLSEMPELLKKNVHQEWKLFREKQFAKVDRTLWDAITESILGFEYDGSALSASTVVTPTPSPSVSPSPTPTPAAVTPTITPTTTAEVTPTLTPNVTPTPTLTPSVTGSSTIPPSATPAVTPTQTPVASPIPSFSVSISNRTIYQLATVVDAIAGVQFTTDGVANEIRNGVATAISGEWGSVVEVDAGDDYEIMATLISGVFPTGPTLGTWHSLNTIREWSVVDTTTGAVAVTAVLSISIRDTATNTVQDTATFTIVADKFNVGR